jgi:hypothetical protein
MAGPIAYVPDVGKVRILEDKTVPMADIFIEHPAIPPPSTKGSPTSLLATSGLEPFFLSPDRFQIPRNREIDPEQTDYSSSPSSPTVRPPLASYHRPTAYPHDRPQPGLGYLRTALFDHDKADLSSPPFPAKGPRTGLFAPPKAYRPRQPTVSPHRVRTPESREADPDKIDSSSLWQMMPSTKSTTSACGFSEPIHDSSLFHQ